MDKRFRKKLDLFKDQVIYAYNEGVMTLGEIAEIYNVDKATVSRFLDRHKVKKRKRGPIPYEIKNKITLEKIKYDH